MKRYEALPIPTECATREQMLCSILLWMPTPECASEVGQTQMHSFEPRGLAFLFGKGTSIYLPVPLKCNKFVPEILEISCAQGSTTLRAHCFLCGGSRPFSHRMAFYTSVAILWGCDNSAPPWQTLVNRLPSARNLCAAILEQKLSCALSQIEAFPKSSGCS